MTIGLWQKLLLPGGFYRDAFGSLLRWFRIKKGEVFRCVENWKNIPLYWELKR